MVNGRRIHIECPVWCSLDHVAENMRFLEDVEHAGSLVDLMVPRMGDVPELLADARIGVDPSGSTADRRTPFVVVDDGGEGFYMNPTQAEAFADNLIMFAMQVRAMARTAGGRA
jgi:hypothetical protein